MSQKMVELSRKFLAKERAIKTQKMILALQVSHFSPIIIQEIIFCLFLRNFYKDLVHIVEGIVFKGKENAQIELADKLKLDIQPLRYLKLEKIDNNVPLYTPKLLVVI